MNFELADVLRLLDAFERSSWDEIDLGQDGERIRILSRDAVAQGHVLSLASPVSSGRGSGGSAQLGSPNSQEQRQVPAAAPPPPSAVPAIPPAEVPPGASPIAAPMLGIFWRAPKPGAPPFVEVGDRVDPNTTLCIIEVMKLMTPIKAGVHGRVSTILVENGEYIDRGQLLFAVSAGDGGAATGSGDSAGAIDG